MEHTSLTERGRSAFQQAEVDKFRNPTAAAAHYITASKCFIAAAEMVDLLEAKTSLAYLGKTMLTNAAFCGGLSGSAAFGPVTETPPLPTGPGGDSDQLLRSPSSSHRRVDIADRGRISGTQQIPKPVYAGDTNSEKSRLECLEELEKELMLLGVLQSSLKGRSAGGQLNKTSIEYSPVSGLSAGNSPTRKITRNSEKLQRALNSSNKYDQRPMIDNTRTEVGPTGMLGGAAQQVLGTMNRLLQSTPLLYGWDPRKGLSYYSGDSDVKHEETTMSISQPWELLDIANEKSSQGVTSRHSEEHVFDPNMSLNLHYSNSPTTTSHQALTAEDETEALSYDGSFKRLMESMSRLSHENIDLQQRVQDLSDIDLKCSEINHLIRKYKEKYDELIANLPSYKDNKDIVYLKRRIEELTSNSAKMEKELVTISEQNKELLEQNSKLFRSASKYKSDIRRIAQILTQQEEIIKKYEAASLAGEGKHDAGQEYIQQQKRTIVPNRAQPARGIPLLAPSSHPSRTGHPVASNPGAGVVSTAPKRPSPILSTALSSSAPAAPGSMPSRTAGPPLSPAASTFANLRKPNNR